MQPESTPVSAMATTLAVFRFELAYQLRAPLFAILATAFFLLAFLGMASDNVRIGGGTENLLINAHFTVLQSTWVFSVLAVLAVVAFVANPLLRDSEQRTLEMFLATGVTRGPYLLGRFGAGTLIAFAVAFAAVLGTLAGSLAPWLDAERMAPFSAGLWLYAAFAVMLPTMLVVSALFFAATCFWRTIMAGYLVAVALIVLMAVAAANTDAETVGLTALFDPFGRIAFGETVRYWTPAELETRLPPFAGPLLLNRLLWLAIGIVAAIAGFLHYRLELSGVGGRRRAHRDAGSDAAPPAGPATTPRRVTPHIDGIAIACAQFLSHLRMELRAVLASPPLWVLLLFGLFNGIAGFYGATSQLYGTPVLPTTALMVDSILGTFSLMVLLALVYYSAELVSRDRAHRVAELIDATPSAAWTAVAARLLVIWIVIAAMYSVAAIAGATVQLIEGFDDIRPGVYAAGLFLQQGWTFLVLAAVAVFLQVLIDRKFVGMFVVIALFLGLQVLPSLGFEHVLYSLGTTPVGYSDFYGFGPDLGPALLTGAYWTAFALLLLVLAHLFARRGTDAGWRARLTDARTRATPLTLAGLALASALFVGLGADIWYQTNIVATWRTSDDLETMAADYERRYAELRLAPQPQIVDVDVDAEIFPRERRFTARGTYLFENRTAQPQSALHLSIDPAVVVQRLAMEGATETVEDVTLGFRTLTLAPPLAPGEQRLLEFEVERTEGGISPNARFPRLTSNGTFVDITHVLPLPGYDASRELSDPEARREHDLPEVVRLPPYEDPAGRQLSFFGVDVRAGFHSRVSTDLDQIAVAPGYLVREWTEGDRRWFEYRMDEPIFPFVAWLSARYERRSEQIDDVLVEVYFHPEHHWNVDAMIEGARQALTYFEREFTPYQYRQFRIFEFPRYDTFAQSFPNTVPFSEAIGFTADLSDPDDLDYVLFVTAHELAHQWWGHQVAGAYVQGSSMLSETLSQYSALMVMEHAWGEERMRRFLRYELDRYLDGRGGERIEELPLARVENQPYIHYRKGSIAMYALRDAIGEDAVNRALRGFAERWAFQGPPFPRTGDLIDALRAETPEADQALVTDLFERIVLWDLAVTQASVTEVDGRWRVDATIRARKFEADGRGKETEAPLDTEVDLAVFGRGGEDLARNELPKALHRERRRLGTGTHEVTFWVDEEPSRVGVDPFHKLIDRIPEDNVRTL